MIKVGSSPTYLDRWKIRTETWLPYYVSQFWVTQTLTKKPNSGNPDETSHQDFHLLQFLRRIYKLSKVDGLTVVPTKRDNDGILCLQLLS